MAAKTDKRKSTKGILVEDTMLSSQQNSLDDDESTDSEDT